MDLFPSWTQLSSTNTNWWHSCPGLLLHLALRWSNFRLLQDLQTSGTSTSARKRKTICSFKNEKCYPTFSSGDCDLDTTELLKLFGLCKTKLNWNWLLLRLFIYLWITGSARQFFPEIQRWNFFVMPCNLRPPPKNSEICSLIAGNLRRFFLT